MSNDAHAAELIETHCNFHIIPLGSMIIYDDLTFDYGFVIFNSNGNNILRTSSLIGSICIGNIPGSVVLLHPTGTLLEIFLRDPALRQLKFKK